MFLSWLPFSYKFDYNPQATSFSHARAARNSTVRVQVQ